MTPVKSTFKFGTTPKVPSSIYDSISKKPRAVKPGEMLYSSRGSPIFARKVPVAKADFDSTTEEETDDLPKEKIKITDLSGKVRVYFSYFIFYRDAFSKWRLLLFVHFFEVWMQH